MDLAGQLNSTELPLPRSRGRRRKAKRGAEPPTNEPLLRLLSGRTVWGGMIAATFVGILFIPALYVLFQNLPGEVHRHIAGRRAAKSAPPQEAE